MRGEVQPTALVEGTHGDGVLRTPNSGDKAVVFLKSLMIILGNACIMNGEAFLDGAQICEHSLEVLLRNKSYFL